MRNVYEDEGIKFWYETLYSLIGPWSVRATVDHWCSSVKVPDVSFKFQNFC